MKRTIVLVVSLTFLSGFFWIRFAQSFPSTKLVKLAPPTNVRVEASENAIKVSWDASPDEANYELAGYNVYFDTVRSVLLPYEGLMNVVKLRKSAHECVIKGLENGRQYFLHVRSRSADGFISAAGLPEQEARPQPEGKKYPVNMFDNDTSGTAGNSGYGWSGANGQGIPDYPNMTQNGESVDILMVELSSATSRSVLMSPSEAEFTNSWAFRNKTLIADIGTTWVVNSLLPDSAFSTTSEIKKGHIYVLKVHDNYHIKLRVDSIGEVKFLLPAGAGRPGVDVNKITFTYVSQLDQSDEQFLTGKP